MRDGQQPTAAENTGCFFAVSLVFDLRPRSTNSWSLINLTSFAAIARVFATGSAVVASSTGVDATTEALG